MKIHKVNPLLTEKPGLCSSQILFALPHIQAGCIIQQPMGLGSWDLDSLFVLRFNLLRSRPGLKSAFFFFFFSDKMDKIAYKKIACKTTMPKINSVFHKGKKYRFRITLIYSNFYSFKQMPLLACLSKLNMTMKNVHCNTI